MQNKPRNTVNGNAAGKISYGQNIASSIIALAAKEINGVASLQGKEVRMDFIGNTVNVEIYVNLYFGFSCSDVAFRIQENVKRSVETMTQYKVGTININILGVTFREMDSNDAVSYE